MLRITFKAGRRTFSEKVDEADYPVPSGVDPAHWARALTIDGDDLLDVEDHLVAHYAQALIEDANCPEFILDVGPEGCTVTVEAV
jgi:hypothetical protein